MIKIDWIQNPWLLIGLLLLVTVTVISIFALFALVQTARSSRKWTSNQLTDWTVRYKKETPLKMSLMNSTCWKWHFNKWQRCGYKSEASHKRTVIWAAIVLVTSVLAILANPLRFWNAILFIGVLEGVFWILTTIRIKERQVEFATGIYKIYRFLALQLTAGMKTTETIRYLHEAVEEPFLKEAMFGFSSAYFRTMDIDLATEELTKRIEGQEVHVLVSILKQGILTGDHYEMIQKQEQLMLRRYYVALEAQTNMIHAKGIGIAIVLCLVVFVLLALPMLYEMSRATKMIFI
jgi:hypothetical protein